MQSGFPLDLLRLVRCSLDGGALRRPNVLAQRFVEDGEVTCERCGRAHVIRDGILSLLASERLHEESARELLVRDEKNLSILVGARKEWSSDLADAVEVEPTLEAVELGAGMTVLELGCGSGRYTVALARRAQVVAVDFSRVGLLVLRAKLEPGAPVALVQADVTKPYAAPRAFDRALSTLHSNLPGREHRMASLAHVADALTQNGRAVISMHHYSGRDLLAGAPAEGRYSDSGIYRCHLRQAEAERESAAFFGHVRFVHICATVPGLSSSRLARAAARIPLVRSGLGQLFLAVSQSPRSAAVRETAAAR